MDKATIGTNKTNETETFKHMYSIVPFGKKPIIVGANDMNLYTAKCIARECYPIYARIFPVRYIMIS